MCSIGVWGQVTSPDQPPFQTLSDGLQRLREEDLDALPASCMGQDLVSALRHINGCEAEFMRRLTRFDTGQGYVADGALSPKPWLRWQCNLSPSAASDRVEVAQGLACLPLTTQAFADGEISYQHAAMIARTAEKLGEKMESKGSSRMVTALTPLDPARTRLCTPPA